MGKAKDWFFWKMYGNKFNNLVEAPLNHLVHCTEGLDDLSFTYRGKGFHFTKNLKQGVSHESSQINHSQDQKTSAS